jgi:tetratricopeptide (TPR) repeat protein
MTIGSKSGPKSGTTMLLATFVLFAAALPAVAQGGGEPDRATAEAAPASAGKAGKAKVAHSDAGKQALAGAKELAVRTRGLRGPERTKALETAAGAYDKVAGDFANEPLLAAVAAFEAADLWRQQGSLPLAEQDYLRAARLDAERFAQRGLLGAADMQRRQKRIDDAMATYAKAAAVDPGTSRAQDARLWQARLLQGSERLDEAIVAFQAALESADPGSETIEACNFLALAWVDKGDLDSAGHVIEHAEQSVAGLAEEDPIVVERLKKALESMSARKALQRTRDKVNAAGKDADGLEASRAK